jgi:hypothetical protein
MRKSGSGTQRGTAIVEFALVLPLLILLSILVVELGRALYQYNTLAKSVRDAARFLSMQSPNTQVAQAKNLVVFGNPEGTGTPLVPGLSVALHVPDPTWAPSGANPIITTVTIGVSNYTFKSMFTSVFGVPFPAMQFSGIRATMRSPP